MIDRLTCKKEEVIPALIGGIIGSYLWNNWLLFADITVENPALICGIIGS